MLQQSNHDTKDKEQFIPSIQFREEFRKRLAICVENWKGGEIKAKYYSGKV